MRSLLFVFCLLCAACQPEISGPVRVIDGDTIDIDGSRVRLWGIDAPEAGTPAGNAATAFLHALTAGKWITCRDNGTRSYGRIVAQCFIGNVDIADVLVDAGHARDWPKFSGGHYER